MKLSLSIKILGILAISLGLVTSCSESSFDGSSSKKNKKPAKKVKPQEEPQEEEELEEDGQTDLFVIDEIGKIELYSPLFIERTRQLLDGQTRILGTVAIRGTGLIEQVKQRADTRIVEVTEDNRDQLPNSLATDLRG